MNLTQKVSVVGMSHLERDQVSGAVLNRNLEHYRRRVKMKRSVKARSDELAGLRAEIDTLKALVSDLVTAKKAKKSS